MSGIHFMILRKGCIVDLQFRKFEIVWFSDPLAVTV